jgi:acyl-CoA thioesterase II
MTASAIRALVNPVQTSVPELWEMTAHRHLCLGPSGAKHQSGGSTVASVITVLEAATQRPLIQAGAQFFGSPRAGEQFQIEVRRRQDGRTITQAVAVVIASGVEVAFVSASLGARKDLGEYNWEVMPVAPPPADCPRVPFVRQEEGDLHSHLDVRLALDPRINPQGRAQFWVAADSTESIPAAFLVQVADYLPEALHMKMGRPVGATSLDNVVRIVQRKPTPWLLCDIQLAAVLEGVFHGRMTMFSQDGTLLACASQSGVVREIDSQVLSRHTL